MSRRNRLGAALLCFGSLAVGALLGQQGVVVPPTTPTATAALTPICNSGCVWVYLTGPPATNIIPNAPVSTEPSLPFYGLATLDANTIVVDVSQVATGGNVIIRGTGGSYPIFAYSKFLGGAQNGINTTFALGTPKPS